MIRRSSTPDRGASLIEVVVVMAAIVSMAGAAAPGAAAAIDARRVRQAAGLVAGRLRAAKQLAVFQGRSVGLVFDQVADRWAFRICSDGTGNGLRRADIDAGTDPCAEGPFDLERMFPGVRILSDASIRGPDGEAGSTDAVRFGRSDLVSFSPDGGCTPGSLFLRSASGAQWIVRIAGVTGRTRVLRYDAPARAWRES